MAVFGRSYPISACNRQATSFASPYASTHVKTNCPLINIRIVAKTWPAVSYLHINRFLYSSSAGLKQQCNDVVFGCPIVGTDRVGAWLRWTFRLRWTGPHSLYTSRAIRAGLTAFRAIRAGLPVLARL